MNDIDLPDFNDLFEIAEEIKNKSLQKAELKSFLKSEQAKTIKTVTEDEQYFINNKPPSKTFIDDTYKVTGLNGNLQEVDKSIEILDAEIEYLQSKFDILKTIISVYQTESANKRAAVI